MNKNQHQLGVSSVSNNSSSNLIDAKLEEHQLCGSKQCPGCGHKLEGKPDWVGLPAGVKFDPTDQELIEHLEAKVVVEGEESMKSHPLIDEFIPTIEGEDGICYTHPEKLPGVTRDGLSRHFFHRPSKAYTTGTRKRRKIQTECDLQGGETRWHKTGKTRPVMVNGKQKGCKKILVLYTNFGKNRKPEKTNWVMHQYHLGQHEEEKEGELVVSKIFFQTQPRQCNWSAERILSSATQTVAAAGEIISASIDQGASASFRRDSGSGSSSSNKEINVMHHTDELSFVTASIPTYNPIDIQQLKADAFGFVPFRKTFDEGGMGEASIAREAQQGGGTCDERGRTTTHHVTTHHDQLPQHHHHHLLHHQISSSAATAYHVSRPTQLISATMTPPQLHYTSAVNVVLDEDAFRVPRILLPEENFQQQHQHQQHLQQQHHKIGGRSASGLEELIMGCTSSTDDHKQESTIQNAQEAEWLKYSSFWPDPDHPDHHQG